MRLQRTIVALSAFSIALMLGLVVVWGGSGVNTVDAQETSENPTPTPEPTLTMTIVEPAALTETVEMDWGQYTITTPKVYGVPAPRDGNGSGDDGSNSDTRDGDGAGDGGLGDAASQAQMQTTPTADDIVQYAGWATVDFQFSDAPGKILTRYKVERRLQVSDMDPAMGWRVMDANLPAPLYNDYDLIPSEMYEYRFTGIGRDTTTDIAYEETHYPRPYRARPNTLISAVPTGTGAVRVDVRSEGTRLYGEQSVTITRYDNIEQSGTGEALFTQAVLQGDHMSFEDTPATPGFYVYKMELFFVDDGEHTSSEMIIDPAVVNSAPVAPPTPSAPVVSEPAPPMVVTGMYNPHVVSWEIANDNKEAAAYEVQRRQVFPDEADVWTSLGTTAVVTGTTEYSLVIEDVHVDGSTRHKYRVVPITRHLSRAMGSVSEEVEFPAPPPGAQCVNHLEEVVPVGRILMAPDVLGASTPILILNIPMEIPFLYDMFAIASDTSPCIRVSSSNDYHMERLLYYANAIDPAICVDAPTEPCELVNFPKDADGNYVNSQLERVAFERIDMAGVDWGFPAHRVVTFHDTTLRNGSFGAVYRVCANGADGVVNCSNEHDSGVHSVVAEPTGRTYPEITQIYSSQN